MNTFDLNTDIRTKVVSIITQGQSRNKNVSLAIARAISTHAPLDILPADISELSSATKTNTGLFQDQVINDLSELMPLDITLILEYVKKFHKGRLYIAAGLNVFSHPHSDRENKASYSASVFGISYALTDEEVEANVITGEAVELYNTFSMIIDQNIKTGSE